MTKKADFNAEEWSLLLEAPAVAGLRIATADRGGTLRESFSIAQAWVQAGEQGGGDLLADIASSRPEVDPRRYGSPDELAGAGVERVRQAVAVLEGKASSEEVEGYKRFVMALAEKAAAAHREGGFLGVGGKDVSENERAALDELASALGMGAAGGAPASPAP